MNGLGYVYGSNSDKASRHTHGSVCKEYRATVCKSIRYTWEDLVTRLKRWADWRRLEGLAKSAILCDRPGTPRQGAPGTGRLTTPGSPAPASSLALQLVVR